VSVEKKARQSAFLITHESKLEPSCWNCGRREHTLPDCTVEGNVEAIKKARQEKIN